MADADVGVTFSFFGDSLRKGITAAEKEVKGFSEGIGKLGIQAGAISLIGVAFKEVLSYTRDLTGVLGENEKAASRLVNGVVDLWNEKDGIIDKVKSAGAATLGFFASIGEWDSKIKIGALEWLGYMEEGSSKNAEISEQAADNAYNAEAWIRKNGKAHKQVNAELLSAEKAKADAALHAQTLETQLIQLKEKEAKLEGELSKLAPYSIEWKKKKVEIAQNEATLIKTTKSYEDELLKKDEEIAKARQTALDYQQKKQDELFQQAKLSDEEQLEYAHLLAKEAVRLTDEERARLTVIQKTIQIRQNEAKIAEIMKQSHGSLLDVQKQMVSRIEEENKNLQRQVDQIDPARIKAETEVADKMAEQNKNLEEQAATKNRIMSLDRRGSYGSMDEFDFREARNNLLRLIGNAEQTNHEINPANNFELMVYKTELNNLEVEYQRYRERVEYDKRKAEWEKLHADKVEAEGDKQTSYLKQILELQRTQVTMFKNEGMSEIKQGGGS